LSLAVLCLGGPAPPWTGGSQPVSIAAVPKNKKFAMGFYEDFIYRYYFNSNATNVY
jgi:hypothetical protein